ncbi:MAG TPA: hypothetical protein VFI31_23500 [Pirellulales bacterium]|nr:hypothetical protein [Pirellulales bacterium]
MVKATAELDRPRAGFYDFVAPPRELFLQVSLLQALDTPVAERFEYLFTIVI